MNRQPSQETPMVHKKIGSISLIAGLLIATAGVAQAPAPAGAPAGSTGLCRDGSYWSGAVKKGACRGHKGVQDWYGAPSTGSTDSGAANAPATAAAPPTTAAPATTAPAPAATTAAPAAAAAPKHTAAPAAAAAPGGGPGQVWVNTSTKVYHCPADRWYGKTKQGSYMTEAQAIAAGDRPDHGKACQ
jgi:hypothetical protein